MQFFNVFQNIDLLSVGVAVASIGILGFVIFFSDYRSITNKTFFSFSILTIIWGVSNYLNYQIKSLDVALWVLRFHIFISTWHAFAFFQLSYVFPRTNVRFPKWYRVVLVPMVVLVSILTLTPFVFSGVTEMPLSGETVNPDRGPGIVLFGLLAIFLIGSGLFLLFKKTKQAKDGLEKKQFRLVLIGALVTFALIVTFNLIFPVVLNQVRFIPLGATFLLPFVMFTAYAIMKHGLLNVKVVATEVLVFVIAEAVLLETIFEQEVSRIILNGSIFILILAFGILLIRSVRKEVAQRDRFELLTKELQTANMKLKELDDLKTDFISIASHQLRTPLTAIKGYSSMILEGTYEDVSLKVRGVIDKIFQSAQRLIYIVNDLLDVSRIEQGKFSIALEEVKAANVLRDVTEELKPNAVAKNVDLSFEVGTDDAEIKISADFNKIRQVFTNLVDNSVKYTNAGYVKVMLELQGDKALISIKDSGIGIPPASMQDLFQKFSRAKGVTKLHMDSSGLGLYIAKEIVAAHGGKVWAESEGEGKGSQFYVLLPVKNPNGEALLRKDSDGQEIEQFAGGM